MTDESYFKRLEALLDSYDPDELAAKLDQYPHDGPTIEDVLNSFDSLFFTPVYIKTGKFIGKTAVFLYWAEPHPLSSGRRAAVRVYGLPSPTLMKTILINESGFEFRTD
jgi:hypothetical protein